MSACSVAQLNLDSGDGGSSVQSYVKKTRVSNHTKRLQEYYKYLQSASVAAKAQSPPAYFHKNVV